MPIKAIYVDFGGVILTTTSPQPRSTLAAEFGMTESEMVRFVFNCETASLASLGKISEEDHWLDVTRRLKLPASEMPRIRDTFFGGDELNQDLLQLLRSLRKTHKIGLISNGWDGLRSWITAHQIDDVFDRMTISCEVGITKPDARIYQIALANFSVNPAEAIFVDDTEKNVTACLALGMHGILFQNSQQVIKDIHRLLVM